MGFLRRRRGGSVLRPRPPGLRGPPRGQPRGRFARRPARGRLRADRLGAPARLGPAPPALSGGPARDRPAPPALRAPRPARRWALGDDLPYHAGRRGRARRDVGPPRAPPRPLRRPPPARLVADPPPAAAPPRPRR